MKCILRHLAKYYIYDFMLINTKILLRWKSIEKMFCSTSLTGTSLEKFAYTEKAYRNYSTVYFRSEK